MKRVLAIDPITRGFGYAVLDGPHVLLDWGLKGTSSWPEPRERWCLRRVAELIDMYGPDRIVVEDCVGERSRRGHRTRQLIEKIVRLSDERGILAQRMSRADLGRSFAPTGRCTKYKKALAIAARFPELAVRLPRQRRPWMSEDARMGLFDAVGLALAFYARHRASSSSEASAGLGGDHVGRKEAA